MNATDKEAPPRVLVVEDEAKTAETIALYLRHAGMEATLVEDGDDALALASAGGFDLVLLDLMLPGMDGREVCRALRRSSTVPVIMVTARSSEAEKIQGLDLGADDYVTKPFSPRELVARVRANLRRWQQPEGEPAATLLRRGDLVVDTARRQVHVGDRRVELTPLELELLVALAGRPGVVWTRERLLARLYPDDPDRQDRTIDAHVKNLRGKLEADRTHPTYIRTVFGVGYKFEAPSDDS